jgi:hypothetical protein
MNDNKEADWKVKENFQFVVGNPTGKTTDVSKVEFRKCDFKHFSAVDHSHYKTETLSKMK